MKLKYFTPQEANNLLPTLNPIVANLVEHQAVVANQAQGVQQLLEKSSGGIASVETSKMVQAFDQIDKLLAQIQSHGVIVKNASVGLIDFLADFNGRDVYLCWKYGEDSVQFFHEIHGGFNGRKPISDG